MLSVDKIDVNVLSRPSEHSIKKCQKVKVDQKVDYV